MTGYFEWALEQLRRGEKVCRRGWNGRGMWLVIQFPDGASKMTLPYIYMKTATGHRVPWTASQADLLIGDWELA